MDLSSESSSFDETNGGSVDCVVVRELISAGADGETTSFEDGVVARHAARCAPCAEFAERVALATRALRLRRASDHTEAVDRLTRQLRPVRLGRGAWLRPALAWCGIVIAWQSVGPLVLGKIDGTPAHIARHIGASGVALACGLLFAAWRPRRAAGLLPFVAALAGATVLSAVFDMIVGQRAPIAETAHLAEIVGTIVLWLLAGSPGWERVTRAVTSHRRHHPA